MGRDMGMGFLGQGGTIFGRKNHWLLKIEGVCDDGTSALPPMKSAKPSLTFKEMEAQHLNETIYFPSKTEWKPLQLTLYDIKGREFKVLNWIAQVYRVTEGGVEFSPSCNGGFKKRCTLEMYDGCGNVCETWIYENAWPQAVDWGDLDMGESGITTIEMTLRYDRAYAIDHELNRFINALAPRPRRG